MSSWCGDIESQLGEGERATLSKSSCTANGPARTDDDRGPTSQKRKQKQRDIEADEAIDQDATQQINEPRRTIAYLRSLPVAEATPETYKSLESSGVVAVATEVVAVEASSKDNDNDDDARIHSNSRSRASLLSVRVYKARPDVRLGVRFGSIDGELQLLAVSPEGPFAASPLKPGDRILSLDNHRYCGNWTTTQTATYLKEKVGFLHFVAQNPNGDPNMAEAAVYKGHPDDKLGITFENETNGNNRLRIQNIGELGLLGGMSVLKAGDFVEAINHIPCHEIESSTAMAFVRDTPNLVTILVKHTGDTTEISLRNILSPRLSTRHIMLSESFQNAPHTLLASEVVEPMLDLSSSRASQIQLQLLEPSFVSVMVHKSNCDANLGIALENLKDDDGSLSIGRILHNGLLSKSPLCPGYKVLAINNNQCIKWSKNSALEYLRCTKGNVTIVAQNPFTGSSSYYAQAMAYKSSPRASIGVSFLQNHGGATLKIGNIGPESIFAISVLNSGDDIIAINHVPCQHMSPSEAVDIVKRATDAVTILVKTHFNTGLVLCQPTSEQNNGQVVVLNHDHAAPNSTTNNNLGPAIVAVTLFILLMLLVASL